jgi:FkbM family methyltransferase
LINKTVSNLILRARKEGLSSSIRRSLRIINLLFRRTFLPKPVKKKIHDYYLLLDPKDPGISTSLILNRTREQQLKYILEKEIKPGDTILDLGANIGYYVIMESLLTGPTGTVYALEPDPVNFSNLEKNIRLNNAENIHAFQLGGSEKKGKVQFFIAEHSNLHTMIPYLYKSDEKSKFITGKSIEVEVVDISSFVEGKKKIDLMRMDIEGYEVEVFSGLSNAIKSGLFQAKIVFECHFPKYDDAKHSMRKQLKMLFKNGYYPKIMTSNNERNPTFRKKGYKPEKIIQTSFNTKQGIYYDITPEDAEYFICDSGGVRDVLIEKR